MDFHDKLKATFRTTEEVEKNHLNELQMIASHNAFILLENIKEQLLSAAENGEYTISSDGKKSVSCICVLPQQMQFHLRLDKNITTTPAVPTLLERQLSQMIGKSRKECRRIANQYRGMNLSTGGKPPESHCRYWFSIEEERKDEFDFFYTKLRESAIIDGIEVEICIYDSFDRTIHSLPVEIVDEWRDKFHYKLSVKCSSIIPETYSSDKPIMIDVDSHNSFDLETEIFEKVSIDDMEGHEFENFCADLLRKNGFVNVSVTKGSGDQGIDIIAIKDGIKYGIQCKCYSSDIGNSAVQEAFAGKTFYKCHVGAVLTNRFFTRAAKDLAESNGILLWDRTFLLNLIEQARSKMN